jgi:uncharacterized coiled-coil protein SlyX
MSKSQMAKRLSRLEDAFAQQQAQIERESILARAASFTSAQRRARIRELIHRLMKVRGIDPSCGENIEDAAVRALHTIRATPSSGMIEVLKTAFRDVNGDATRST